jgi:hypothetical protein
VLIVVISSGGIVVQVGGVWLWWMVLAISAWFILGGDGSLRSPSSSPFLPFLHPHSSSLQSNRKQQQQQHWTTASFCHPPTTALLLQGYYCPSSLPHFLTHLTSPSAHSLPSLTLLLSLPFFFSFFSAASSMLRCALFFLCHASFQLICIFSFVGNP